MKLKWFELYLIDDKVKYRRSLQAKGINSDIYKIHIVSLGTGINKYIMGFLWRGSDKLEKLLKQRKIYQEHDLDAPKEIAEQEFQTKKKLNFLENLQ